MTRADQLDQAAAPPLAVGDAVEFRTDGRWERGTVTRTWDRPVSAPYVTVRAERGGLFVRAPGDVRRPSLTCPQCGGGDFSLQLGGRASGAVSCSGCGLVLDQGAAVSGGAA